MTPSDDLQRLVERIEASMQRTIDFHYATKADGWRRDAAEYAVIALALRARITQEQSNG